MIRELRADPSTRFFEPILCGGTLPPPEAFGEHPRGEPPVAHPRPVAPSRGRAAKEPAVVELEQELPLTH